MVRFHCADMSPNFTHEVKKRSGRHFVAISDVRIYYVIAPSEAVIGHPPVPIGGPITDTKFG